MSAASCSLCTPLRFKGCNESLQLTTYHVFIKAVFSNHQKEGSQRITTKNNGDIRLPNASVLNKKTKKSAEKQFFADFFQVMDYPKSIRPFFAISPPRLSLSPFFEAISS